MNFRIRSIFLFAVFPFIHFSLSALFGELFTLSPENGIHHYYSFSVMFLFALYQAPASAALGGILAPIFMPKNKFTSPGNIAASSFSGILIALTSGIIGASLFVLIDAYRHDSSFSTVGVLLTFFFIYFSAGLLVLTGVIFGLITSWQIKKVST